MELNDYIVGFNVIVALANAYMSYRNLKFAKANLVTSKMLRSRSEGYTALDKLREDEKLRN
jgi:hypothetical protein